ncbi:NRT1/ PTR family protein 3.1 [Tanacetum coccineum]
MFKEGFELINITNTRLPTSPTNLTELLINSLNIIARIRGGDFTKIQEAINSWWNKRQEGKSYVIYFKAGVYEEYVMIEKEVLDITICGGGINQTIITGDPHLGGNVINMIIAGDLQETTTFQVWGSGFLARDITFRNTAGAELGQLRFEESPRSSSLLGGIAKHRGKDPDTRDLEWRIKKEPKEARPVRKTPLSNKQRKLRTVSDPKLHYENEEIDASISISVTRKLTRVERGISFLTRMSIGFAMSVLSTLVPGFIEIQRKNSALAHDLTNKPYDTIPILVFWLVPQYSLHGMAEAFMLIENLEFFYDQAPESTRSIAIALIWMEIAAGNYGSTLLVSIVHKTSTGQDGSN